MRAISKGHVAIDVGANTGVYNLRALKSEPSSRGI